MCKSPINLRNLFSIMLVNCGLSNPKQLWYKYKEEPCEDILQRIQYQYEGDVNEALRSIGDKVQSLGGDKLELYGRPALVRDVQHRLVQELIRETLYSMESLQAVSMRRNHFWGAIGGGKNFELLVEDVVNRDEVPV
ncbi:Hypothetical predicted protein [Octopus vulgaris]|uniref:Uncharacterized protein n=1 Tax=Octopus vulgaris TaxID=6645 RepID=A0AA36APA3_OCTVU|nr:Hypothetical predicted protein [Octopus vulgaris]